jgi:hypothetical protein
MHSLPWHAALSLAANLDDEASCTPGKENPWPAAASASAMDPDRGRL